MNVIEAASLIGTVPQADDGEIRRSWRWSASRWHPDRGGDHEAMQRINAARDYLLSMTQAARKRESVALRGRLSEIMNLVDVEVDSWEARNAAAKVPPPEPTPTPKTTKRRAAQWEARNSDKVREQTKSRVAAHRARNPDEYRAYMREYMKNRRTKP